MLLAELELWHSRPIAPTRRVSLGRRLLPVEPAPGFGGLLLGAVVAAHMADLDDDLVPELSALLDDLQAGRRIPQPRLRHRFQEDHIGLARSRHRLVGHGDELDVQLDSQGSPASQVLGAAYACGRLDIGVRPVVMDVLRRAIRWRGGVSADLLSFLSKAKIRSAGAFAHPELWALGVLGFDGGAVPARRDVQRRFRDLVREAHPDAGAAATGAAQRIADLSEARDILLA
ncbi:MAG TPA: hypothetical protein VEA78_08900 [Acidimicrobiales bacterium]|nr:hypothetical protein [Acidimicrobiales bacterium]